jgi:hypothetical protein
VKIIVIDVSWTNVRILATREKEPRKFPFGPKFTPKLMVSAFKEIAKDWSRPIGASSRVLDDYEMATGARIWSHA